MSVIAHEYGHMVSNRMVAGPNAGLARQPGAARWARAGPTCRRPSSSTRRALVPVGDENPFAVGPYVTGDKVAGIRNYAMNQSPLNYSDVGYDFACNQAGVCTQRTQVHADGEIWSATNYDIRQAFIEAYNASFPAGDIGLQQACVGGDVPVTQCPGNRRWAQLVFDAWLLMASGAVSMVDARNAHARGRPDPLRRREPGAALERVRRRGLGDGAASAARPTSTRRRASSRRTRTTRR